MADKKISQLTAATTPLAGTEVLPIVQSGSTVKVTVSDITTGRAISVTEVTLTTGNIVIGTEGKGIDFSATPGTGTSELLADYEEGTWVPTLNATGMSGVTYTTRNGKYIKVGDLVFITAYIAISGFANSGSNYLRVEGIPFVATSYSTAAVHTWNLTGGTTGNAVFGSIYNQDISFSEVSANGDVSSVGMQGSRLSTSSIIFLTMAYTA